MSALEYVRDLIRVGIENSADIEAQGGVIHFACCGPERECFTKGDGEPLGPDDPIPTPDIWADFDDEDEDEL